MSKELAISEDYKAILKSFGITPSICESLRAMKPFIAANFDAVIEQVYAFINSVPELKAKIPDKATLDRAYKGQKKHFLTIFSADFGPDYFHETMVIGQVHARIGLTPHWYMSGYSLIYELIVNALVGYEFDQWHKRRGRLFTSSEGVEHLCDSIKSKVTALGKVAIMDMELSLKVYFEENLEKKKRTPSMKKHLRKSLKHLNKLL